MPSSFPSLTDRLHFSNCLAVTIPVPEPGGIRMLLLKWLRKQCSHPARGLTVDGFEVFLAVASHDCIGLSGQCKVKEVVGWEGIHVPFVFPHDRKLLV